jgi:hypothetical protein
MQKSTFGVEDVAKLRIIFNFTNFFSKKIKKEEKNHPNYT